MTLLHLEGFDAINSTVGAGSNASTEAYLESRYTTPNWDAGATHPLVMDSMHSTGQALVFGIDNDADLNSIEFPLIDKPQTVVVGFNHFSKRYTGNLETSFVAFRDMAGASVTHIDLLMFRNQHIQVRRGSQIIYGVTNVIQPMVWQYIEVKVTISNTVGAIHIKVNGITVLNETSIDTKNGVGSDLCDNIYFKGQEGVSITDGEHFKLDDIYILDDAGSTNNDFLGPLVVETLFPDGAGDDTDWTPSAGSNFQNVDEVTFDGDTTYNSSNTATNLDLFTADDLAIISGTVYGVAVDNLARVTEAGPLSFINKVKSALVEGTGGTQTVSAINEYFTACHIFEQDPDAVAAWTPTTVNAMQIGYEVA